MYYIRMINWLDQIVFMSISIFVIFLVVDFYGNVADCAMLSCLYY